MLDSLLLKMHLVRGRRPVASLFGHIPLHLLHDPDPRFIIRNTAMLRELNLVLEHCVLGSSSPRSGCARPAVVAFEVAARGGALADELGSVAAQEVAHKRQTGADDDKICLDVAG